MAFSNLLGTLLLAAASHAPESGAFPPPLHAYGDAGSASLLQTLQHRIAAEPFNLVATIIFLLAIAHTFLAARFTKISHRWAREHRAQIEAQGLTAKAKPQADAVSHVSFKVEIMHFLGEVEAIFGIWAVPLLVALTLAKGWPAVESYVGHQLAFTEPMFVVVIMCIAATRPVLRAAESALRVVAQLGQGSPAAWWLATLTIGPLLGSFITEPAAMTICALLLARRFYELQPSPRFCYATLGLLFVNVSVGGTMTHFAAPPVLMVAAPWGWTIGYMLAHFAWKAVAGIVAANLLYFAIFRREFAGLRPPESLDEDCENWEERTDRIPAWITAVHLGFLAWTVFTAHYPALFIGGFLFFLAFTTATEHHQNPLNLKPALLVGFFLAGLVVHGGLQGWWIEPVLGRLGETPLLLGAMLLTAFNDNAAITYLATLVPNFSDASRYAIVAGAVAGGGLTVIANAPNPAGQSILGKYFPDGISPLGLLAGALLPTITMALFFLLFR